jgi:hypothetical protein
LWHYSRVSRLEVDDKTEVKVRKGIVASFL